MTKLSDAYNITIDEHTACEGCHWYDFQLGVCASVDSDHYFHCLNSYHPACRDFKRKEPQNGKD